jgi:hypothetical protein
MFPLQLGDFSEPPSPRGRGKSRHAADLTGLITGFMQVDS